MERKIRIRHETAYIPMDRVTTITFIFEDDVRSLGEELLLHIVKQYAEQNLASRRQPRQKGMH